MRLTVLCLIVFSLVFISCKNEKPNSDLTQTFIQSLKDGKFEALARYFPTREFYKSLEKKEGFESDTEIDSFLDKSNQRVREDWNKIKKTVDNKNIDLDKVKIKETVVFNPYNESAVQGMVVVYEYDNKLWDDLAFIVKQQDQKTYLLEIPTPTKTFSFSDSSLAASSQAKAALELEKPGFSQSLRDHVRKLINWAKDDNSKEFSGFVIYTGGDETRRWKSAVDTLDPSELKMAVDRMNEVKNNMSDCTDFTFDKLRGNKESEGNWIVQPVVCGKKIIYFAFLKVKDKLLLGDVDTETTD